MVSTLWLAAMAAGSARYEALFGRARAGWSRAQTPVGAVYQNGRLRVLATVAENDNGEALVVSVSRIDAPREAPTAVDLAVVRDAFVPRGLRARASRVVTPAAATAMLGADLPLRRLHAAPAP